MEKQMELFEDGGLKDEGGMVDEQSGNDVPVGSSRKEVRDDIPAMLSEGEFVFPADVVRYHGLDKLMELRQEAKMGLKQMEAMGQMGNSEEATIPDDMPFGPADLVIVGGDMDDGPREMAEGGVVYANQGTFATGIGGYQPSIYQGQQTSSTYTPPPSSVAPPTPTPSPAGGYMPKFVTNQATPFNDGSLPDNMVSTTSTNNVTNTAGVSTASTEDKFVPTIEDKYVAITYINKETGEKRDFYFYNGSPVTPIEDGFVPYDESVDETVSDLESTVVESTQVTGGNDDPPPMETPEPVDYGALSTADLKKAYAQNQTAVALMAGLTAVNPIFGLFGSWATRSTRNTITEEMKRRGIKVPESTGFKGVFGSIVDGIKDMLGLDDDQTTAVKSAVEKDNSPPKIYKPKDPTKGDFSTSSSSGIVKVTPSKSVQDSVSIVDKDPMEQFGGSGPVINSSNKSVTSTAAITNKMDKDNSPPRATATTAITRKMDKDNSPPKNTSNTSTKTSSNKAKASATKASNSSKGLGAQTKAGSTAGSKSGYFD
jgi:hypothetical protein